MSDHKSGTVWDLVIVTGEEIKPSPFTHIFFFSYPFIFYVENFLCQKLWIQEEIKHNPCTQEGLTPVESAM